MILFGAICTAQFISNAHDSRRWAAESGQAWTQRYAMRAVHIPTLNRKGVVMIRVFQATLLIGFAIVAAGGGALAQTARGPSTENLLKADNDSANWMLPARSYSGNRQVDESE